MSRKPELVWVDTYLVHAAHADMNVTRQYIARYAW
jgi:hypothetical protein